MEPTDVGPTEPVPPSAYQTVTETTKVEGPPPGRGGPVPLHVVRQQLPQLRGGGDHPRGDDRRRPGGGDGADSRADTQARRRLLAEHADVHHRASRRHLEHRLRRRLPRPDPPRSGGVQERRPTTRWPGIAAAFAGVAAGFGVNFLITPLDGVLDRDHERRQRHGQSNRHRSRREPLLRDRLDDLRHVRPDVHHGQAGREPAWYMGPRRPRRRPAGGRRRSPDVTPEAETRGLRFALWATLAVLVVITLLTRDPGRSAAQPRHRRGDRRLAVHGQPDRDHHAHLLRRRVRLRPRCRDDQGLGRCAQDDHEVVGRARGPALPVPADRAVHRLLQLQQDRRGRSRSSSATSSSA